MLIYRIVAQRSTPSESNAQIDAFDAFLGALRLDGHVLGRELLTVSLASQLHAYVCVPAGDAFETRFRNEWIQKSLVKMALAGVAEPEFVKLGEDPSEPDGCSCADTSSLILFTEYLLLQSPARCGDCFHPIPLYRLPRFESGEFVEVIAWLSDYKACDSLFMNSSTGERFAYRQMSQVDSSLSLRGRKICQHFEQATRKATYYYLHRYYGTSGRAEGARRCPGCGGEWRLSERWHEMFDFRCDACRFVSAISPAFN